MEHFYSKYTSILLGPVIYIVINTREGRKGHSKQFLFSSSGSSQGGKSSRENIPNHVLGANLRVLMRRGRQRCGFVRKRLYWKHPAGQNVEKRNRKDSCSRTAKQSQTQQYFEMMVPWPEAHSVLRAQGLSGTVPVTCSSETMPLSTLDSELASVGTQSLHSTL